MARAAALRFSDVLGFCDCCNINGDIRRAAISIPIDANHLELVQLYALRVGCGEPRAVVCRLVVVNELAGCHFLGHRPDTAKAKQRKVWNFRLNNPNKMKVGGAKVSGKAAGLRRFKNHTVVGHLVDLGKGDGGRIAACDGTGNKSAVCEAKIVSGSQPAHRLCLRDHFGHYRH